MSYSTNTTRGRHSAAFHDETTAEGIAAATPKLRAHGLDVNKETLTNSDRGRCDIIDDPKGKGDGEWIKRGPVIIATNYKAVGEQTIKIYAGSDAKPQTAAERRQYNELAKARKLRQEREAVERQRMQRLIAQNVSREYQTAGSNSPDHPYWTSHPHSWVDSIRQSGQRLIAALEVGGKVVNLQYVDSEGRKRFKAGALLKGAIWQHGQGHQVILVAEGWATAAAIHNATGYQVIAAMSKGGLELAALNARTAYPDARIIIAADDDWSNEAKTGTNTGLIEAGNVARKFGLALVAPPRSGPKPINRDFADIDPLVTASIIAKVIHG